MNFKKLVGEQVFKIRNCNPFFPPQVCPSVAPFVFAVIHTFF